MEANTITTEELLEKVQGELEMLESIYSEDNIVA